MTERTDQTAVGNGQIGHDDEWSWEGLLTDPPMPPPRRHLGEAREFPTVDLAELAEQGIPAPTLLCGELLYRGALHSLAGPPDSGKSTLLYLWMLQLLAQGERVVLLDEESGREQVTEKLLSLGGTPEHLTRLAYVEFPTRSWDDADRRGLADLLERHKPALVGADSSAAFLAVAGHDENHAADVTRFYKGVLLSAARDHKAAVVVLDHLAKNGDGPSRFARGSGAKLATVDVAFMLDPVTSFSRHQGGLLKLKVTKDRRGYLHRDHEVKVDVEDGQMAITLTQVDAPIGPHRDGLKLGLGKRRVLTALHEGGPQQTPAQLQERTAHDQQGKPMQTKTVQNILGELEKLDPSPVEGTENLPGMERYWSITPLGIETLGVSE